MAKILVQLFLVCGYCSSWLYCVHSFVSFHFMSPLLQIIKIKIVQYLQFQLKWGK